MNNTNGSNTVQAAWLGAGRLVSLGLSIASVAILSRYLSKGDYGTYKQILYVYSTLQVIFTLGIPKTYSYFLARASVEEGKDIVRIMNKLFLVLGIFLAAVLYVASSVFADILNNTDLKSNLQLFSITPVFLFPLLGIEGIVTTYRKAYIYTVYVISCSLFSLACVIVSVIWFGASVQNVVGGFIISSLLRCVVGLYLESHLFRNVQRRASTIRIGDILKYSIPLLYASICGIIISSANPFFVSRYFGSETFAEFSNGFIELPIAGIVINSAATVLLPVFSRMVYNRQDSEQIIKLWRSVAEKSAKIIFPLAVFSFFYAEQILVLFYGNRYANSAIYFRIITVVNLIRIVPYAPVMLALGKMKEFARLHMMTAIMIVVADYLCVQFVHTAYAIALVSVLCTTFCICSMLRYICKDLKIPVMALIPYRILLLLATLSAVSSGFAKGLSTLLPDMPVIYLLAVSSILAAIFYFCLCKFFNISYSDILNTVVGRQWNPTTVWTEIQKRTTFLFKLKGEGGNDK